MSTGINKYFFENSPNYWDLCQFSDTVKEDCYEKIDRLLLYIHRQLNTIKNSNTPVSMKHRADLFINNWKKEAKRIKNHLQQRANSTSMSANATKDSLSPISIFSKRSPSSISQINTDIKNQTNVFNGKNSFIDAIFITR